jgi:hypothetical protein
MQLPSGLFRPVTMIWATQTFMFGTVTAKRTASAKPASSNNRDANTAETLLGGTSGNLTIDGYAAYNGLSAERARTPRYFSITFSLLSL